jgi:hypothetical protein
LVADELQIYGPFMVDISWDVYMVVDLKVHVEIVHYTGRQGSNMRARDSFFPELAKVIFGSTDLAWFSEIFSRETPAKDNRGVRERFAKVLRLFAKSGSSQIKECRSTAIYLIIWWRFETNPLTTGGHHLVHFLFSGDESMPAPAKRHVTDPTGSMTITSVHLQRNFCDAFWIILMQILRASDTSLVFLRVTDFPYVEAEIDWGWRSWWLHQRGRGKIIERNGEMGFSRGFSSLPCLMTGGRMVTCNKRLNGDQLHGTWIYNFFEVKPPCHHVRLVVAVFGLSLYQQLIWIKGIWIKDRRCFQTGALHQVRTMLYPWTGRLITQIYANHCSPSIYRWL